MKKKFYYAVKAGRKTGVFDTWKECEMNVKGYKSASFKKFESKEEAWDFVKGNHTKPVLQPKKDSCSKTKNTIYRDKNVIEAYVDGSYDSNQKRYSYGAVILHNCEMHKFSDSDNKKSLAEMRNVSGELMGSIKAMDYALEYKDEIDLLIIYHDYEGIAKWCTGEWKARKTETQKYKKYYDEVSKMINIKFVKVKAHSGVMYNEEADRLAKEALYNNG